MFSTHTNAPRVSSLGPHQLVSLWWIRSRHVCPGRGRVTYSLCQQLVASRVTPKPWSQMLSHHNNLTLETPKYCKISPLETHKYCKISSCETPNYYKISSLETIKYCKISSCEPPNYYKISSLKTPKYYKVSSLKTPKYCNISPLRTPEYCKISSFEIPRYCKMLYVILSATLNNVIWSTKVFIISKSPIAKEGLEHISDLVQLTSCLLMA